MPRPTTAILFLTHEFVPWQARRFERILRESAAVADSYVLLHDDAGPVRANWLKFLRSLGHEERLALFDPALLSRQLGYDFYMRQGSVLLGSTHLPLVRFARTAPYRRFWQVENDVEYRGHWGELFAKLERSDAPVLATHIVPHSRHPQWAQWPSIRQPPGSDVPRSEWRKAFFPIARFDRTALDVLEDAHRAGWGGHYEGMVPTVLRQAGLEVRDLRAHAPCYEPGGRQSGVPTSIRWRPHVTLDEFAKRAGGALLFHPLKGPWYFDGRQVVMWKPKS